MPLKIALLQFSPQRKNIQANIKTIEKMLSGVQADLIALPELANSGYLYAKPEDLQPFSEPGDDTGIFLSALKQFSKKTGGLIIAGYAEKAHNRIYNSAAAVSSEGIVHNYRKIHLYGGEKNLFMPGDEPIIPFNWQGISIGMMICFDWFFPETARSLALQGAQIIAHPANLVLPYCQDAMVTRSIENRVFTITANRNGSEELGSQKLAFTGSSQMTDPTGKIIFRAPADIPVVHTVSINPSQASSKVINPKNDLFADRKTNLYSLD